MAEAAIKEWDEPEAPPVATEAAGGDDVAVAEAPAATEPPSSSESESDPLDRLLGEYDQGTTGNSAAADFTSDYTDDELAQLLGDAGQEAAARQQHEQEFAAAQQRYAGEAARSAMEIAQRDRQLGELRGTVEQLQRAAAEAQWRQHQARSFEDFKRLTAAEQAKLEGLDVSDDHVETFLLAESARDPELARAFEGRYYTPPGPLQRAELERAIMAHGENLARTALQIADPQQRRLAEQHIHAELRRLYENTFPDPATYRANAARYVHKALDRMHREARRPRIDLDATADRLAVAAAVRGASSKVDVREPAPNWGELSDAGLNAFTKRLGVRAI
jgi:hypothetical protein